MTTIYFVRHGTYENPQKISPVRLPGFPLSKEGIKQIEIVAEYFKNKKIRTIYTSPILRTKQTAEIIGRVINIQPVVSESLIEIGTPFQGYDQKYVDQVIRNIYVSKFHSENGGESIKAVQKRMKSFVSNVEKAYKEQNVIAVSHGDPIILYLMKERGYIVTGDNKSTDYGNYKYIPMGGILKAEYSNNKLLSLQQINY